MAGRDITEGDDGVYSSYDGSGVSTVARGVADIGIVPSTSTWQNTDVMPIATAEDWAKQNKLRQEWLAANPDATYIGWTSI